MADLAAPPSEAEYVGTSACASCHSTEAELWRGSHHDLAMQDANGDAVLGDFSGVTFTENGITSVFFRRDGGFFVRTEGADGTLQEFEVSHVFGVDPLQQVLIPFPDGRLQALAIAWDTRPIGSGGQRWFSLYPEEQIAHDDVLHWTGPAQNWNFMCAECHSTGVEKNYDLASNRYATTWNEIDVGCEACHGPGSLHVRWSESGADPTRRGRGFAVDLRNDALWQFSGESPIARRARPRTSHAEIDTCARCHARRANIAEPAPDGAFLDAYRPALLDADLYHADGQIQNEVYVWGSFLQSRMYAAGVTCSDCHDPHALAIDEPDRACVACHEPDTFSTKAHHHHGEDSPGASCVACHMPAQTYMEIDPRRDHSIRIPRPDLTQKVESPNACTQCHTERTARWATDAATRMWGPSQRDRAHWGETLHAGRNAQPGAHAALAHLAADSDAPAIVRASSLRLLRARPGPELSRALELGARDEDPLVRLAAAELAGLLAAHERYAATKHLLHDPVFAVRIEAARALAMVPSELWTPRERDALMRGLEEYREAQWRNRDRPEAHVNLGALYAQIGDLDNSRIEYETALRVGPHFVPTYLNLADLNRALDRDEEGEHLLREALAIAPDSADAHHALGLLLVRQRQLSAALIELERAATLAPEQARYVYVYAVALDSAGEPDRAREVLETARQRHPEDGSLEAFLGQLESREK